MTEANKNTKPYYPDIIIFLVFIPFISAFNYYLTYSNIKLNGFLALTFTIDTAQGYLAWWAVRAFIIYLDKKWPYEKGGAKRILFQLITTSFIGLIIISALTELVSLIAKGKPAPLAFYTIDLFIISIWFFVINGIYIGLYYFNLWRQSEAKLREETRVKSGGLLIKLGKQEILLPFQEIAGFYVENEYPMACLVSGKKYYLDKSLDKVQDDLPQEMFFRLNRQFMLHRQLVTGFRRLENGKIMVMTTTKENFPSEIPVSRTKAAAFKAWFRAD